MMRIGSRALGFGNERDKCEQKWVGKAKLAIDRVTEKFEVEIR
jgi:hypothetical protein